MRAILFFITLIYALFIANIIQAQSLSGIITNEEGESIPYANIFIKELGTGTSCDFEGKFFMTLETAQEYNLVISALGYESKNVGVLMTETENYEVTAILQTSSVQMEEIIVRAKKKDPAFGIIKKVIDAKDKYIHPVSSSTSEIYLKSYEKVDITKKKKEENKVEEELFTNPDGSPIDPFEQEKKKLHAELRQINMVEMQLTLHHQAPNKYKEIRNAFSVYGNQYALFIPTLSDINFSFYKNLVKLNSITDVPIISPISNTAILSYKYKLLETQIKEDGQLVYKIKVMPRKKGNAIVSGIIYINEGLWNIRSLDLKLYKSASKFYDEFRIQQSYTQKDGIWIIDRHEFDYETKVGKRRNFVGRTLISIDDFKKDVEYTPKFFGNELSVMTKEALERDSAYWESNRAEPLSEKQGKLIAYQDSVQAWIKSDVYQDSLEAKFNKVDILEVAYEGISFRNHRKKQIISFPSLLNLIDYSIVGGLRVGPGVYYFRRFENRQWISTSANVDVGLRNKDLQGYYSYSMLYNPKKLAWFGFNTSRSFESLNYNDAILNQLRASNYYLNNRININHRFEVFNGFYLRTNAQYNDRKSAVGFNTPTLLSNIIDDVPSIDFDPYKALITRLGISYTPEQRYMTEPNRKLVLGSKYPTFSLLHTKGWSKLLGSDVNYDRLEVTIDHRLTLGTLGTSSYRATAGKFINQNDIRIVDVKRFNQSNPIWVEDPTFNFNRLNLDSALTTVNAYVEAHYIHHFNGALINNIPLIKKLRIQAVAGGGILWLQDGNLRHEELFAGIERTFKLGARRRLRLAVYGTIANSNFKAPSSGIGFHFDILDTWSRNWNF